MTGARDTLRRYFLAGVSAVRGQDAVATQQQAIADLAPSAILSVGKAAVSMMQGVDPAHLDRARALAITKAGHVGHDHGLPATVEIIESSLGWHSLSSAASPSTCSQVEV